jgi:hypothetical protein
VLSTGLLVGSAGGAIAWADETNSSGSTAQSQGTEGPSSDVGSTPSSDVGSTSEPVKKVAQPLETTLQGIFQTVNTTLRSLQKQGQHESTDPKPAQTKPAATNAEGETEGSSPVMADTSPAASDSYTVESGQTVTASDSSSDPQTTDPFTPVATVVGPVTNPVATVTNVVVSLPGLIASLPTSATPVTDVISSVQDMLTSVTNAMVPLIQVPADLASLLGVPAVDAAATVGGGFTASTNAPVLATRASQWLEVPKTPLVGSAALPEIVAPLVTVGDVAMTSLRDELPVSGIASPAQNVIDETGIGEFLEHTVGALLVPASLSALAAVALPGVGGLLIICAAGMRIGYRQAKALMEVRRAGIASFAGPGPLGVLRTGSLIAMRRRSSRVVRQNPSLAACHPLEQAA